MNGNVKVKTARKAIIVIVSLGLSLSPVSVFSATNALSDVRGHWAERQIMSWIEKGHIHGYADETIKPDSSITRAEFMTLVNRTFDFKDQAEVKATDVDPQGWEYEQVAIAMKTGYINGYEDGSIKPGNNVSRQEVAMVISKLLKLNTGNMTKLNNYKDAIHLPDWSKPAFSAVVDEGIFDGYENGLLGFDKNITRAEAIVALNRAKIDGTTTYDKAGTYENQNILGNVLINASGITLQNMTIKGDLTLAEGIGEGDVTLQNVTVQGDTFVNGGGANSIHFKDSSILNMVVNKGIGVVSIVAEGQTTVKQISIQSNAQLDNVQLNNGGLFNVKISSQLPTGSKVSILGNFETVEVAAQSVELDFPSGQVKTLSINEQATDNQLSLGKETRVDELILKTILKVRGEGKIGKAIVEKGAGGSSFQTPPSQTIGVGGFGGGGGGGSRNNNTAPVASDLAIDPRVGSGQIVVGQTLTGVYTYRDNNPEGTSLYKWYSSAVDGSDKQAIPDATSRSLVLTYDLIGKYISFEVVPVSQVGTPSTGNAVESGRRGPVRISKLPISNVIITGDKYVGSTLTGSYSLPLPINVEDRSTYQWYVSDYANGAAMTPIPNATNKTLELTNNLIGKYVSFGVWPYSSFSMRTPDIPVQSVFVGPIEGNISVTGLTYFPNDILLSIGQTQGISLQAHYDDLSVRDVTYQASWISLNPSIATVGLHDGTVKGVSIGNTVIQATYGLHTSYIDVVVSGTARQINVRNSPLFGKSGSIPRPLIKGPVSWQNSRSW